jgi:flagellin-specific chaperone FliS
MMIDTRRILDQIREHEALIRDVETAQDKAAEKLQEANDYVQEATSHMDRADNIVENLETTFEHLIEELQHEGNRDRLDAMQEMLGKFEREFSF